ncbi:hypothetical protein EAE96_003104 [Botrytis aclada]|nr:hypothetical protein EAE96_003104 [Botrytis aclada]
MALTQFALSVMYPPCIALTKLSIVALLRRIFSHLQPICRYAMIVLDIYLILWLTGLILVVLLQCHRIDSAWSTTNTCSPSFITTIATGTLNAFSDIGILIFPQPLLWGLQLDIKKRALIPGVFLFGAFVCIISIVRIFVLRPNTEGNSTDPFRQVTGLIFTVLEPTVGIMCACLPVMQHIFIRTHYWGLSMISLRSNSRSRSNFQSLSAGGKPTKNNSKDYVKLTDDEESVRSIQAVVATEAPIPIRYK